MRKSLIFGLILLLLLGGLSSYFLYGLKNEDKGPVKNIVNSAAVSSAKELSLLCKKDSDCYLKEVTKVMEKDGIDQGLKLFIETSKVTNGFYSDCHNLSHLLGQKAFAISGEAALDSHLNTCSWGYGHGVMLGAAKKYSAEELGIKFQKYCAEDSEPVGCIHGIGHSMQENKSSLADTIKTCHIVGDPVDAKTNYSHLTDKTTVGACVEGWVMQGIGSFDYKNMKDYSAAMDICGNVSGFDGAVCRYMSVRNWVDMGIDENERFDRLSKFSALCGEIKEQANECGRYLGEATDDLAVVGTAFVPQTVTNLINKYCPGSVSDMCVQSFTIFQINRNNGILNNMSIICPTLKTSLRISCEKAIATRKPN